MSLSVLQKGLVLAAVPLLFQLAFVLAIVWFQRDHDARERLAAHTKDVISEAREVHTLLADAEAGVRGYVIARDRAFVGPYQVAVREMPSRLDELSGLVSDNHEQSERARSVRAAAEASLAWQGGLEQLVRGGETDEATARIRSGRGQTLGQEFRRELAAFLAEEERLDRERLAALERSRVRLNSLFVVGGVLAVVSTLAVALAFRRGIAARFAALEDNARRLAAGETLTTPLGGGDEIAHLDRAFRHVAGELTRASAQIRDLYDNAPCGYHSVDPDGTVVAMNRTELRWLGYDEAEVIGRKQFVEMVSPASRDAYRAGFARVKENGSVNDVELELVRKDGAALPVLLNSSAVRDAEGRYLQSRTTLTLFAERKKAEQNALRLRVELEERVKELVRTGEELRVSEERFRLLVESIQDYAILMLDPDGRVASWSPGAERVKGYRASEVVGRHFSLFYPPEAIERGWPGKELESAAAHGRFEDEGWRVRKDGSRFWANVIITAIRDSAGRLVGFGKVSRDMTSRKQAEDQVRELNANLEERVRARTAELETANRDLAQRNAENEMFVYSVSHDLRSPLVNLQGFSRELEKACRGLAEVLADESVAAEVRKKGQSILEGKVAKSVGFIQTAVMRLSNIIDALLRLSRAGRVEYRWESVDMAQVVSQVVKAAQVTIAERGATVRVGELPPARGDRTAVEQVFGNLVGNALTYLDPARPGEIEVGVLPGGPAGSRTYFVRDNGLGIAEGHQQKIFQAFQRAHPGVGSGEGLGLAIVARVVERHRGRLWVESRPGEGSTFFVTLPASPDAGN